MSPIGICFAPSSRDASHSHGSRTSSSVNDSPRFSSDFTWLELISNSRADSALMTQSSSQICVATQREFGLRNGSRSAAERRRKLTARSRSGKYANRFSRRAQKSATTSRSSHIPHYPRASHGRQAHDRRQRPQSSGADARIMHL